MRKKNNYYDVEKLKGIFKSIVAFTVILFAFIYCEYYFISANNFKDEKGKKKELAVISINVGETVNLSNFVSNIEDVKYVSFKNDNIYNVDEEYNIMSTMEGEDELKVLYKDNSDETLYFKTKVDTSNVTVVNKKISKDYITLDNRDATNYGAKRIYVTFYANRKEGTVDTIQYYIDNTLSKQITATRNKINTPSKKGYTFKGYYTKKNGKGTKVITERGYLVPNVSFSSKKIYAYFEQ